MATTDQYTIIGKLKPTRQACRFLGGATDCFVTVDAAAIAAKADTTGTITAWVMIPVLATATGTILGYGDDNVVEFIQFSINAGLLTIAVTDAATPKLVVQADSIEFVAHKWHHVAVVQDADTARGPILYVDGKEIASTLDTPTTPGAWGSILGGLDKGLLGCANKAGNSTETEELAGYLNNVRYYNAAKSAAEILAIYEYEAKGKGTNDTTNLRNHWKLEVNLLDSGSGADNGTAGGGALVVDAANEFASKLTFMNGVPVVADTVVIAIDNGTAFGYVIQAA